MALIDKLNAIGDAIRLKTGKANKMTLDEMPTEIEGIEAGTDTSDATATEDKVFLDETFYADGKKKTGTFTIASEISNQDGLISAIKTALKGKASGGGEAPAEPIIEPLEVTENGTYTAPSGVDGYSPVSVNVPIPNGYIKPSGTLNIAENGTYDVTEKASVVVSIPEKEIVLQNKTIDANGTYTADSGYDGFGQVTVNVQGGTNTESAEIAAFLSNTMEVLDNSLVTSLRTRVCQSATKLVTVNLPNVTSLGAYAFYQCSNLETFTLPKLTTISTQTWYMCPKLEHADCGQLNSITAQTFNSCAALKALILRKTSSICTLSNANGVSGSGIGKGTGYVYVPADLIEAYKTATNWSTFANQFRAIEDYPDICGGNA